MYILRKHLEYNKAEINKEVVVGSVALTGLAARTASAAALAGLFFIFLPAASRSRSQPAAVGCEPMGLSCWLSRLNVDLARYLVNTYIIYILYTRACRLVFTARRRGLVGAARGRWPAPRVWMQAAEVVTPRMGPPCAAWLFSIVSS